MLLPTTVLSARGGTVVASLFAALLLLGAPAGAQSAPPAPSPSPVLSVESSAIGAAPATADASVLAAAPVKAAAPSAATANPFSFRGAFRSYDFTRENASSGIGGAGQVNQQSIELGLSLHGDYRFGSSPFSVGATYEYAAPTDGCGSPKSHLAPPCGKLKAPALNPDDSLPGFIVNTLYEAYAQYKDPRLFVRVGDQVFNSLWTSSSDTRIKPTSFQGADLVYTASPLVTFELADMIRFQGRVNSTFERNTLMTSFPAATTGAPPNIFIPGGNDIPTSGFQYGRVSFNGTHGLVSSLHLYKFDDIANFGWLETRYTAISQKTKPYLALHGGIERETGAAVLGKIYSTPYGAQLGASMTKNVSVSMSYERAPRRTDTIRLPAGDTCNAKQQITVKKGTTLPYLLPVAAPECIANADGTTTIQYGGMASPYTDGYGTDPLWDVSLTQSPVDRRAPFSGPKAQLTWTSNDKRLIVYVTQSYLEYGNTLVPQLLSEVNADATFYANKLRPGPYKGLQFRYRYGSRQVANVTTFGSLPLFKYNRAQMEYDF